MGKAAGTDIEFLGDIHQGETFPIMFFDILPDAFDLAGGIDLFQKNQVFMQPGQMPSDYFQIFYHPFKLFLGEFPGFQVIFIEPVGIDVQFCRQFGYFPASGPGAAGQMKLSRGQRSKVNSPAVKQWNNDFIQSGMTAVTTGMFLQSSQLSV